MSHCTLSRPTQQTTHQGAQTWQRKHTSPPLSHDLLLLAQQAGLGPDQRLQDLLDLFTTFNISARYPDYKQSFYRKCTSEYTAERLRELEVRAWLLGHLAR